MSENSAHDKTDPGIPMDPDATQVLKTGEPKLQDTQPMRIIPPPPRQETVTTQSLHVVAPLPEARQAPARASRPLLWVFGILAVAILGGSVAYYFLYPGGEAPAPAQAREEIPAALIPYLDKAAQGDSGAMRMLGTMYYNGLNVPMDRKEGVKWYRKAAAAGNVAARKDLEQLGLAVDEK